MKFFLEVYLEKYGRVYGLGIKFRLEDVEEDFFFCRDCI